MSANALRSALAEFGIVAAQELKGLRQLMQVPEDPTREIPEKARIPLQVLARQWERQTADQSPPPRCSAPSPALVAAARAGSVSATRMVACKN